MFNQPDNNERARVIAVCLLIIAILVFLPTAQARASISQTWVWPIAPPHLIERSYVPPPTDYGVGHRGIDIIAPLGTPVFSPATGTVLFSGNVVDRTVMSIDHGDGVSSSFEAITAVVVAGDSVNGGDLIGYVSEGPHCTCLHLGARINGDYVSPLAFLTNVERAVLLPWRD